MGDDSLIRLGRDDLAEILGDKKSANLALELYLQLEDSRKASEGDMAEDTHPGNAQMHEGAEANNSIEEMLRALTLSSVNSGAHRDRGSAAGISTVMPMFSEMAKAINALSDQVNSIAKKVSKAPEKVAVPVKIQIDKIQHQMLELQKSNAASLPMDREMLLQMNALLNPNGVRRMRSGGLRPGSSEYMRSPKKSYDRHKHKQHLMGLHSVPDEL